MSKDYRTIVLNVDDVKFEKSGGIVVSVDDERTSGPKGFRKALVNLDVLLEVEELERLVKQHRMLHPVEISETQYNGDSQEM